MNNQPGWIEAIARLLMGGLFLYRAGIMLVLPGDNMGKMLDTGVPAVPAVFVVVLTLHILCGLALTLGYRTRVAAVILILYMLIATLFMQHSISIQHVDMVLTRFFIIGGLLLVVIHGPGILSFDGRNMVPVRRRRH